ncbi:YdcF family protein [Apilactobacillus kunkeei]|uniref:Integral membrane protein n=1 Tax=Apilactobacillus kunkeei DSM 12361 = ATCC 700308 TaxID=1423768 RepID=A0A0R1FUQ6_9LACO|nr:YdcF family protein [Apilactobacillus kunkeei]KRK22634.1 integral membrane protein [Apilactobacillus kunkeei DSM 12361 = ATCC 700308]QYU52947.1 YdcF family protein [Apilactobacillus kunkeei]WJV43279.1 YdcF family protein [Apilactobacillus kunkeei]
MSVFALTGNVMFFSLTSSSKILHAIFLVIALAIMVIITLIYALHAVLLIWNGIIVWRRESHSLANLLTLIIGVFLLIYPLLSFLFFRKIIPKPYNLMIEHFTEMGAFYMISIFLIFSLSVWICNFYRPKPDKDFIIILGAGLLNGNEVSPLLASRIDRAIDFYQTQINSGQKHPLIICSGGQGGDERIPEGVAMRDYVLQKNINPDDVVAEDKSVNTIQNFAFSKKIVDRYRLDPNNGIFVSNNYHIYRASDYAKSAGMKISGIGSKTSGFFLPNAIIREFIAILMKHKIANLLVILLFIVISIVGKL